MSVIDRRHHTELLKEKQMSPKSLKHVEACDSEVVRTLHVLLDRNVRERTTVYYIFVKEEEQTLSTTLETRTKLDVKT